MFVLYLQSLNYSLFFRGPAMNTDGTTTQTFRMLCKCYTQELVGTVDVHYIFSPSMYIYFIRSTTVSKHVPFFTFKHQLFNFEWSNLVLISHLCVLDSIRMLHHCQNSKPYVYCTSICMRKAHINFISEPRNWRLLNIFSRTPCIAWSPISTNYTKIS